MTSLREKIYRLLRGSEGFFKADMVYVAKGGFWVTFGQAGTSLLSLILVIVVANLLPKETYGLYRYALSLAGALNIFTLTGMNRAVARAVASGQTGVLSFSVRYQLKWHLLMTLAFWGLGLYYFLNGNNVLAASLVILSFFAPATAAFNTYSAYLEGKREFRLNNIFSIFSTLTYVTGMLLAILFVGEVVWLVAAYALTTLATSLIFYLITVKKFEPAEDTAERSFITYGWELTYIGLMAPVVSQLDKIILSHFWGASQLAVYALALAVPERATGFIKGWVGIAFPKLAQKTREEIDQVFYKRILQGLCIGALATLGYIIVAPYLFTYLLPQYLDSIEYSQILSLSFIFAMPNRYVSLLLESQKLSRLIFLRGVVQNVIMLALYAILGTLGGIMGLVIAQVLNALIGTLINVGIWRRAQALPAAS